MRQSLLDDCLARSSPLTAVLDPTENASLPPDADPADLLADWRDRFDSEAAFRDRLDLAGLTVERARERLRASAAGSADSSPTADAIDPSAAADAPDSIPSRFETAERVVDRATASDRAAGDRFAERHPESPFVHLVAPLAEAVREGVSLDGDVAPAAVESLEDRLFDRLTEAFQHPLFILFKAYQQAEYPDAEFDDATDSTAVYEEFVAEHRDADYERVFETYPLLLERLGVVADQWRGSVRRLDERIAADRADLARTFGGDEDLGRVCDLTPLSDDPHGDGEIVWGVHFESDCSVVYKPRSVACEAAANEVLDWVNARAGIPDLYAPAVLDRGEYGWMEFVPHRAVDSPAAVERFYERMGGLSALAFVLGSTDLHHENVVAMGDVPVIVDQETALAPRLDGMNSPSRPDLSSFLGDSILDTLLVPITNRTDGDGESPTNGLSELAGEERSAASPNFRHPNADAMDLTFEDSYRVEGRNLPRLDGDVRGVSDHLSEFERGFREVTEAVRTHRDELLDPSGPLGAFEGCEIRHFVRPTSHYVSKLSESRYSSQLRSGVRRSLAFEPLYEAFLPRSDDDGDLWRLAAAEKRQLRRSTVPRFTVEATGRELTDGRGRRLGAFVGESPMRAARRRISALDDHRVETQLRLVEFAFTDSTVADPIPAPSSRRPSSASRAESPSEVVSHVVDLVDDTLARRPDGSLRWAEFAGSSRTDRLVVRKSEPNLYRGQAGVGLFLAAVAAVRDDDELADRSRRVLTAAESAVETDDSGRVGIGGTTGKGSVAYGLLRAGDLLGDVDLVARAGDVAGHTTASEIAADEDLDVMSGAAGELLAQLAVHERTGDDAALDRARRCGDRLLDAATETDAGYRVPTGEDGDRRFAFAHGVGGIGTALVRLGAATGDDEYADVGRDALRFDADLWRRGEGAGADGGETIWGWCNGAAGVGTSRVAAADATDRAVELPDSFRASLETELSAVDTLCCGSAGRALFMLDAGETFGDPALADRGEELFADVIDRASRQGRLRLSNHLPALPNLGLFTGATGVGYVALRFEARERGIDLPNVTRLE